MGMSNDSEKPNAQTRPEHQPADRLKPNPPDLIKQPEPPSGATKADQISHAVGHHDPNKDKAMERDLDFGL